MWVVTTEDETVNLEGATSLKISVRYVQEELETSDARTFASDRRDTDRLEAGTVAAVFPGQKWPTILASVAAAPGDTKDALLARAQPYLDNLRQSLARRDGLCDLRPDRNSAEGG